MPRYRKPRSFWAKAKIALLPATLGLLLLATGAAFVGLAGGIAFPGMGTAAIPGPVDMASDPIPVNVLPVSDPKALVPLSTEAAVAANAAIPFAQDPIVAARPFSALIAKVDDWSRSLECMTAAIYYEAGNEPVEGQQAVAQVVLNRVRHPAFPRTVCGVVFQGSERTTGCQFTFTCDGSTARAIDSRRWRQASRVASAALAGAVYAPVGLATHYHADYVLPYWASSLSKSARIGQHVFYRWKGGQGLPTAFTTRYAGGEPLPAELRRVLTGTDETDTASASHEGPARDMVAMEDRPIFTSQPVAAETPAAGTAGAQDGARTGIRRGYVLPTDRWVIGGVPTSARVPQPKASPTGVPTAGVTTQPTRSEAVEIALK